MAKEEKQHHMMSSEISSREDGLVGLGRELGEPTLIVSKSEQCCRVEELDFSGPQRVVSGQVKGCCREIDFVPA